LPDHATERRTVQNPLIKYAVEAGWKYVSQEEAVALRKGETGVLFYGVLQDKLHELNKDLPADSIQDIINRIEQAKPSIEGNYSILQFLKGKQATYLESEKRNVDVMVIDFENPGNNIFHVTDEWQFTNGQLRNREDIVFLINGIPVIVVETKSAQKKEGIEEGVDQIRRYHEETPEMLAHAQVFDVTHLIDFYYGVTWSISRKNLFKWKSEANYETKVKEFFNLERILKLIQDYIVFTKKDDELSKIILRQHQTRAVEKVVQRAVDAKKHRGLIWHTQGSGKTYTMITVASILLKMDELKKPTIIMLVDRNELETQLFNNLAGYGFGAVEVATTKAHLQKLLKSDYRGLLVTMIHKFDKIPANLNTRNGIIVLVDEAHRTTSSDLGNYLFACIPNATFLGFTGTPIDKIAYGKGTFKVFGIDDEKGYLDKYSIKESIEDGTTLKLNYALASNEMLVPKEQLEKEFFALKESEGVSDIEELNKILEKAVNLRNFLKSKDRVKKVAQTVAEHYTKNVEPLGYKAFLVGVDREACVLLKEELDKFLAPEYSKVVFSAFHNDKPALKKHHISEDKEKQLRKLFIKVEALPKILIVTEKLLTGFDAPILYAMYLDKPMRDHTLLQAIARVNRPYEDSTGKKKPYGFVMDFVGIFDKLEKALAFDSDVISGVINDLQLLKDAFVSMMKKDADKYLKLMEGKMSDKTVENIIQYFADKTLRDEFNNFFKELSTLYEIISPDAFLRPYIENYRSLSEMHNILKNAFENTVYCDREFLRKTALLVRERVSSTAIDTSLPVLPIDEHLVEKLTAKHASKTVRVINLIKIIRKWVEDKRNREPYLIEIGERAERIREMFENRQMNTLQALKELEELVKQTSDAEKEREEKRMDIHSFTVYWVLKENGLEGAELIAKEISDHFVSHEGWDGNDETLRSLKTALYKTLMKTALKDNMVEVAERILKLQAEVGKHVKN